MSKMSEDEINALRESLKPGVEANMRLHEAVGLTQSKCHLAAYRAGWWNSGPNGEDETCNMTAGEIPVKRLVSEKLGLIHTEISEAFEGDRKNSMDDKLPWRKQVEVELADAYIRICDTAGGLGLDLAGAVVEKMAFNAQRADHKLENRLAEGGKRF